LVTWLPKKSGARAPWQSLIVIGVSCMVTGNPPN
jgi:hypothetical protein